MKRKTLPLREDEMPQGTYARWEDYVELETRYASAVRTLLWIVRREKLNNPRDAARAMAKEARTTLIQLGEPIALEDAK